MSRALTDAEIEGRRHAGIQRRRRAAENHAAEGVIVTAVNLPTFQLGCLCECDADARPSGWTFEVLPVIAWVTDLLDDSTGLLADGTRCGVELWPAVLGEDGHDASTIDCGYYTARRVVVGREPNAADELAVLLTAWGTEYRAARRAGVEWVVDDGEQPPEYDESAALDRLGRWQAPRSETLRLDRLDLLRAEILSRSSGAADARTRTDPADDPPAADGRCG